MGWLGEVVGELSTAGHCCHTLVQSVSGQLLPMPLLWSAFYRDSKESIFFTKQRKISLLMGQTLR